MVDVSHNNGPINYGLVPDWVEVVGIKKSQGTGFIDPRFAQNWASFGAAGKKRVAYHFLDPNNDASAQAAFFLDGLVLGDDDRTAVDIEDSNASGVVWGNIDRAVRDLKIVHFCEAVKAVTGRYPIIYWSEGWAEGEIDVNQFVDYFHWYANYNASQDLTGLPGVLIVQFSQDATVPGIGAGTVDLDVVLNPWF